MIKLKKYVDVPVTIPVQLKEIPFVINGLMFFCSFIFSASNWASGEDDHVVARAEYDFIAASEEEISLRAGDMLNLAPKGDPLMLNFHPQ